MPVDKGSLISRGLKRILVFAYRLVDHLYLPLDRNRIRRTRNIRLIPKESNRRGGKYSYAEWAHVIGIFQTLIFLQLENKQDNVIVDIGCGTGLLGIASEPFIGRNGKYVGIDVMKEDIDYCRQHYISPNYEFFHLDTKNPIYAPSQSDTETKWPVDNESADLVTALSVWTHLSESDALFYFREIARILRSGGKAIVTAFLLDKDYEKSLKDRSESKGRYHMTQQDQWIFDQPSYGSNAWFHPEWASVPEEAIGFTPAGLDRLTSGSGLKLTEHYPGNWKEFPGVFFQDILIFQKPGIRPPR